MDLGLTQHNEQGLSEKQSGEALQNEKTRCISDFALINNISAVAIESS